MGDEGEVRLCCGVLASVGHLNVPSPLQFGAHLVLRGLEIKGNTDEGVYVISRGSVASLALPRTLTRG